MTRAAHMRGGAVATAAVLLSLGWMSSGCRSSLTTEPGAVLPPSPQATLAPPEEASLVALDDDSVVEIHPETGQVVRRHVVDHPAEGIEDLEVATSRRTVLVSRRTAADHTEIVEVPLGGGPTSVLAEGAVPALTSDGARVAFTRRTGEHGRLELVVAGHHGPELAVWPAHEAGDETLSLTSLAWDPTGRRLAFTLRSALGTEVRVLSVDRDGTLRGASDALAPTSADATPVTATFRTPRVLTVAERCCEHAATTRWRLVDVDLETGWSTQLAAGLEHAVTHLDWTPDQQRLAITLDGGPSSVMSWHDGVLEPLAEQFTAAEW